VRIIASGMIKKACALEGGVINEVEEKAWGDQKTYSKLDIKHQLATRLMRDEEIMCGSGFTVRESAMVRVWLVASRSMRVAQGNLASMARARSCLRH